MKRIILIVLTLAALASLVMWAAARNKLQPTVGSTHKLQVSASMYPMAEFSRQIGGDKAEIATIVPPGVEPHDYEPTAQALAGLERADVFVYNGVGVEPWAAKIKPGNKQTFIMASRGIDLIRADGETDIAPEAGSAYNPHVWLDPVLAQQEVLNILEGFQKADPNNAAYYANNADIFIGKLKDLDKAFRDGLTECSHRYAIVSHDMLAYVANRYGFTVQSISGFSPEDEPTPQKLALLTQYARDHQVSHIFYEDLVNPRLSETIASEAGVKTLVYSPLEGLTKTDVANGKNYLTLQQQNLQNLRTALGCK